jgi:probable rRNA maturation factor
VEATTKNLEAVADIDIPPRIWADLVSAVSSITQQLFPHGVAAVRVMDDTQIRQLNRDYRGIDSATDVLSFPPSEDGACSPAGDIALNWDAVVRQAGRNGNTMLAEAVALATHGLLHLAGWDHATAADAAAMDGRTRALCNMSGIQVGVYGH